MTVRIGLLGPLRISRDGVAVEPGGQRQSCLLAVLLLNHGRTVSRADLAGWAWPAAPPATVDRQIANYVAGLRRTLAPVAEELGLLARHPGFSARLAPQVLDVDRFTALLGAARTAHRAAEHQLATARVREALDLWQGQPLDGLDTPYLRRQAAALEARRREGVLLLAELELAGGRPEQAVEPLRELLAGRPADEAATLVLIRALTVTGQQAEAAEAAARATRALVRQGHRPGPALQQAHREALTGGTAPGAPLSVPVVAPGAGAGRPRRQLPPDTSAFTGRDRELRHIIARTEGAAAEPRGGAPLVCTIDGMAGIGKSALAVRAAHLLADRFPDGQLHLDLHTHSTGLPPRSAFEALGVALTGLGLPPQAVPPELDARTAAYRAALSGTRTLICLDDVSDEAQVRALLPGGAGCLVLVTSRKRLKGLDDTETLSLDPLPEADAVALFRATCGRRLGEAEASLLAETVAHCGRHPLALRITASLLRHRRAWGLGDLLAELREGRGDLEVFDDGSRSLAAAFDLSYRALPAEQRTLFRLLGRAPGRDVDAFGAAALLDCAARPARRLLQALADRHLLAEPTPGRFTMHDLLREYARALARAEDPATAGEAALDRLFDYYERTARRADRHTRMVPREEAPEPTAPGERPPAAPRLDCRQDAEAWLAAEIENVVAAARYAAHRADPRHAVTLPLAVASQLYHHGPWPRALELLSRAAGVAGGLDDAGARAAALLAVGPLRQLTGDRVGAAEALHTALDLYHRAEDPLGQANILTELGRARLHAADYPAAAEHCAGALRLYQEVSSGLGQANALSVLGRIRQRTGDYRRAIQNSRRSLLLYRRAGNPLGQSRAHSELGTAQYLAGGHRAAMREFLAAHRLCEELNSPLGQAVALLALAAVRRRCGNYRGAALDGARALELARELGNRITWADALTERGLLRGLTGRLDLARLDCEQALELHQGLGQRSGEAGARVHLGIVQRLQGDWAGALDSGDAALRVFTELGEPGNEVWALTQHAAALRGAGRTEESLRAYRRALELSRALSKADDEAASLEGVAEHLLDHGDPRRGADLLDRARRHYHRLGMRPDLCRVSRRLAALTPV
ncbi:BTAD domain-containing putative transcriptional regulator [Kitasatospora nipponensis]|uniref:BTAD domain-containing putative transcriptional regulator n=1 Tax=Kitasatospora nipponensis TaxID=258049 RepID=A0ABN1VP80_9ACTN